VSGRQIILDTETTGIDPEAGHNVIEIGCIEMVERKLTGNRWHHYIKPERAVEAEAIEVHGISNEFLADKPSFAELAQAFLEFVRGAELIIHNAAFDIGFLNAELARNGIAERVDEICSVIDTLMLARKQFPGQRNSLDALCRRYGIDNSQRELHGALLDAEILADVYLALTGGQTSLQLGQGESEDGGGAEPIRRVDASGLVLPVVRASRAELARHEAFLDRLDASSGGAVWRQRS
jgi:DNA polymerase-3 subunit epsilon